MKLFHIFPILLLLTSCSRQNEQGGELLANRIDSLQHVIDSIAGRNYAGPAAGSRDLASLGPRILREGDTVNIGGVRYSLIGSRFLTNANALLAEYELTHALDRQYEVGALEAHNLAHWLEVKFKCKNQTLENDVEPYGGILRIYPPNRVLDIRSSIVAFPSYWTKYQIEPTEEHEFVWLFKIPDALKEQLFLVPRNHPIFSPDEDSVRYVLALSTRQPN